MRGSGIFTMNSRLTQIKISFNNSLNKEKDRHSFNENKGYHLKNENSMPTCNIS